MSGKLILEPELFFLEPMEKAFVRVGAMFLFLDHRMKRGVLRFQFLGDSLTHRRFLSCGLNVATA